MNQLLLSNIKKSLKIVAEEKLIVPENLIEVVKEESDAQSFDRVSETFIKSAIQPIPWFYRDSSQQLQSSQQSFFGFYSLRNIFREIRGDFKK